VNIEWIRRGTLDSIASGLIHISRSVQPLITRTGDIIIAEHGCAVGGRAVRWAYENNVALFITSNGATKLYGWLPTANAHARLADQIVASHTPHVIDAVARWMLEKRFGQILHPAHGVNVVRGREGAEVRKIYAQLSKGYNVPWGGRQVTGKWEELSPINKTLSLCNAALYGLTEIAILYSGYSPYFGFLHGHSGKGLVYDIADIVKFEHITPIAFRIAADGRPNPEWRARAECARLFRRRFLLRELIKLTEETMDVAIKSLAQKPSSRSRKSLP